VAERSIKCREACADRREAQARQRAASIEVGVVFRLRTKRKPPRLRQLRWLREILLMTQPPLLFKGCALSRLRFAAVMQGGECASPKRCDIFFHSGHDLRSPQSMKMFLFCPLRWHSGRLDLHFLSSSYESPGPSQTAPTVICTLAPNSSSYNAYLDQRPTGDAMELAGKVNAALAPMCRPNCPTLAMFRNSSAPNAMLINDAGRAKILYKPEFFTAVYETYGDGGILAILAHEVGHAIDAGARSSWIKSSWTAELRADAWAGCAVAKMNLSATALKAALTTLSKYPSPSHPDWTVRLPVLRAGYTQCGGDGASFDKASR
jgi:hypothetical protein